MYALIGAVAVAMADVLPARAQSSGDSARTRRQMADAARAYESALRRHAHFRFGAGGGSCDEVVGRFCLTYDRGRQAPLPPEGPEIVRARARAISAFRAGGAVFGPDSQVVTGLVRYLLEADSAGAAVAAAAAAPPAWRPWLEGLALFYARRIPESETHFARGLAQLDSAERVRAGSVLPLLTHGERGRVRRLSAAALAAYQDRLWRLANALYLTPGNEVHAEHLSRYVWSRILSRAPVVANSFSWGWDVEELTRRFGVPKARTQDYGSTMDRRSITEWFDPEQLQYVPPEPSRHALDIYLPRQPWPYDTVRSRNGFAPPTVRAMTTLEHQPSTFYSPEPVLRVDTRFILDSIATGKGAVEFGVFVLDSTYGVIAEQRAMARVVDDTAAMAIEVAVPAQAFAYSVEALEPVTRQAARGRHLLVPGGSPVLLLSDPVLLDGEAELPVGRSGHFPALPAPVLREHQRFGIYLEAAGAARDAAGQAHYRVQLLIEEAVPPGPLTRAARGLGRVLGRGRTRPIVTWSASAPAAAAVPIAFRVDQVPLRRGLHRVVVEVTDLVSGLSARVQRVVRVE